MAQDHILKHSTDFSDQRLLLFLKSLVRRDYQSAESFLSPIFFMDEGMARDKYLSHEAELFSRLTPLYKLSEKISIRSKLSFNSGISRLCETQLINEFGQLVYEWAYTLDSENNILGNGSRCQTVSKVQHCDGDSWWALAIEAPEDIVDVRPMFNCEEIWRTETSNDGRFWNLCFRVSDDRDKKSFYGNFRIRYKQSAEIKRVWMRGTDRPLFTNNMPTIVGQKINLNAALPWSLSVKTLSEESYIEFPRKSEYHFQDKVIWACLTDALDHDWIFTLP